ncbi:SLC13 family permease [Methanococcus voltae]|uniref:Anion transporter n=1 Tax=Methanococcus voltae (strain ATCC BAA-1334 / A3) TaxID=456320 RepID=D7DQU3_METV3|nr:SLC13 family permease [Methanococcus voltae]MCS3900880.1 anion transporter [Methanococcus voltae]
MKKAIVFFIIFLLAVGATKYAFNGVENTGELSAGDFDQEKAILTLIILIVAGAMLFTEAAPLAATAMLVPVALSFPGIDVLSSADAFSQFGNKWVVLFMAAFILGDAVFRTGFADKVGQLTVKGAGKNKNLLLILVMLAVGGMSAFLSNTGTTAVFIPIVMGICASASIKPGKILMPMAFAASLGGTMTLVGTPPNGLVNSTLEQAGLAQLSFFDFAQMGLILFVAGILYYALLGHKFLPDSDSESTFEEGNIVYRREKMWVSMLIFLFVLLATVYNIVPITTAFMLGACLVVITGCITMQEAFNSISWTTIFLFAGMLSLSIALTNTGAAAMIANICIHYITSPMALLAVTYILTAITTNFMSNTATAALIMPIGLALADAFDVSAKPILIAIAMAASACFLTPIATPPNMIVLGPGGYKFKDYFKAGWPLQLICGILVITITPLIWPF